MGTQNIDLHRCWVESTEIGFGWSIYIAWAREFYGPVGFVWGNLTATDDGRDTFDVCGSYVLPDARRNGVRTLINREILKVASVITTNVGSRTGGEAFMRSFGYKFDRETGTWYYIKPRPPRKRAAAKKKKAKGATKR